MFDVSGDGAIDEIELQMIMQAVNGKPVPIEEIKAMMKPFDHSGDHEIQLPEFLELMALHMSAQEPDEELIAAFKVFGAKDENDTISFHRLEQALKEINSLEEFEAGELRLIFNEIEGASRKSAAPLQNSLQLEE